MTEPRTRPEMLPLPIVGTVFRKGALDFKGALYYRVCESLPADPPNSVALVCDGYPMVFVPRDKWNDWARGADAVSSLPVRSHDELRRRRAGLPRVVLGEGYAMLSAVAGTNGPVAISVGLCSERDSAGLIALDTAALSAVVETQPVPSGSAVPEPAKRHRWRLVLESIEGPVSPEAAPPSREHLLGRALRDVLVRDKVIDPGAEITDHNLLVAADIYAKIGATSGDVVLATAEAKDAPPGADQPVPKGGVD